MIKVAWFLMLMAILGTGCAQKSETEKLQEQLQRSGKEWERNSKSIANDITNETQRISEKMKKELEEIQ